jgi:hypothetical protein
METRSTNLADSGNAAAVEELQAEIVRLTAQLRALPQESVEARLLMSELATLEFKTKLLGPIVKAEPLTDGVQTGKMILTLKDGTKAIFKPASGEGGRTNRRTE